MSDSKTSEKWMEAAYDLFAVEGPDGIQVERLARILNLNKSGFYHYFKDAENFYHQLLKHHTEKFDLLLYDLARCKNVDPDCLNALMKHKITMMAQIHLVRNRSQSFFLGAHKELDEKLVRTVLPLWIDHIDIHNNPDLAGRYLALIRDMFYARVNWENFNFYYLRELSDESKEIVEKIIASVIGEPVKKLNGIV